MSRAMCLPCVLLSCVHTCLAFELPLPSRIHVPKQVQTVVSSFPAAPVRAAEGAVSAQLHDHVSEHVQDALRCCRAFSAECLACAAHQDITSFCAERRNFRISGCNTKLQAARALSRDHPLNDIFSGLASRATHQPEEDAVKFADEYLDEHPDVARTSVADMTNAAFNTMSSLKSWLMSDSEESDKEDMVDALMAQSTDARLVTTQPERSVTYHEDINLSDTFSFQNPWVVVVCALFLTAISSGIALGALAHARLQSRAREPLLSTLLQDVGALPSRQTDAV